MRDEKPVHFRDRMAVLVVDDVPLGQAMTATKENKRIGSNNCKPAASPLTPRHCCTTTTPTYLFLFIYLHFCTPSRLYLCFRFRVPVLPLCGVVSFVDLGRQTEERGRRRCGVFTCTRASDSSPVPPSGASYTATWQLSEEKYLVLLLFLFHRREQFSSGEVEAINDGRNRSSAGGEWEAEIWVQSIFGF